jgi:aryl-alcohol dehydrogenase-like predicted oxidoreductase
MIKRNLGNNGTKVFPIGLGGMSFSDAYGETNTNETHRVLTSALDIGIDHIDTSDIYGLGISEERIGLFLAKNKNYKEYFKIATKGGIERNQNGNSRFNNSKKYLEESLDNSLKRLGVDCIELYYVHRRDQNIPIEEVTQTLSGFVKSGKVKQIGYSEISPSSLEKANCIHNVGAVQSEYSLSTRYPELGLIQKLKKLNATLIAFSPLGRSLLTDKPHSFEKAQTIAFLKGNPRFLEPNLSFNIQLTSKFRELASDYDMSAAELALSWLLNKDKDLIPIPGTRSIDHLESMAKAAYNNLSGKQMKEIDKILYLGWAHGDRYSEHQWIGPEKYC